LIKALRRAGALPILAWIFLFPPTIVGLVLWERWEERRFARLAIAPLVEASDRPIKITSKGQWAGAESFPRQWRLVCGRAGKRDFAVLIFKRHKSRERQAVERAVEGATAATGLQASLMATCRK
jgi:hypothetical protein